MPEPEEPIDNSRAAAMPPVEDDGMSDDEMSGLVPAGPEGDGDQSSPVTPRTPRKLHPYGNVEWMRDRKFPGAPCNLERSGHHPSRNPSTE